MFAHHCTACDARHLIFPSQVMSITNVDGGFATTYQCWCGAEQVWLSAGVSRLTAEVAA
jgi:hypothetical protein